MPEGVGCTFASLREFWLVPFSWSGPLARLPLAESSDVRQPWS